MASRRLVTSYRGAFFDVVTSPGVPGGRREENYTNTLILVDFLLVTGRPGAHTTAMPSDLGPRDDIAEVEAMGISL